MPPLDQAQWPGSSDPRNTGAIEQRTQAQAAATGDGAAANGSKLGAVWDGLPGWSKWTLAGGVILWMLA
jgi:hypothetical protein